MVQQIADALSLFSTCEQCFLLNNFHGYHPLKTVNLTFFFFFLPKWHYFSRMVMGKPSYKVIFCTVSCVILNETDRRDSRGQSENGQVHPR